MKKYLLACLFTLFAANNANAGFIEEVSGADLMGIEVMVEFADGSRDIETWRALSATAGGIITSDWGIMLNGDSHGVMDMVNGIYSGLFIIANTSNMDIVGLTLNVLDAGFVFDTEDEDLFANGSGTGTTMVSDNPTAYVMYGYSYMDELFGQMTVMSDTVLVAAGRRSAFVTDIDMITADAEVPAPAGLSLMLIALAGLVYRKTRK